MSVNSNTSQALKQNIFKEYFGFELHSFAGSDTALAKRDFSESVQAALRSGLTLQDMQTILDAILCSEVKAKEVQ